MDLVSGYHQATAQEADEAKLRAAELGIPTFVLSTVRATSKADLFDAVRASLPLEPPLFGTGTNFDALNDSVGGGIIEVGAETVLLVWEGSAVLAQKAPKDFKFMSFVLEHLVSTVGNPKFTCGRPTRLCVYVVE